MLVEPHNHHVNAAKRAIQTFKDHFISALATTDIEFPLQLWNKLTSQVVATLNLMRASRINPRISAYEAIWGSFPPRTPRMQGCHIRIPRRSRIMGQSWNGRMVPRPIARPLPVQSLLRPRNTSISHIRFGRAIPPTLPGPSHVNTQSYERTDERSSVNA